MNDENIRQGKDSVPYDPDLDRLFLAYINLLDNRLNSCIYFLNISDNNHTHRYICARLMLLNAGISLHSFKLLCNPLGLHSKDAIVLFRVVFEGIVNCCYILASVEEEAEKALRHARQKKFRLHGKDVKVGPYVFNVISTNLSKEIDKLRDEFTTTKGREINWSDKSISQKIDVMANKYGDSVYLNFGITNISFYREASERIHSSLYGVLDYISRDSKEMFYENIIIEFSTCLIESGISVSGLLEILENESGIKGFKEAASELMNYTKEILESIPEIKVKE